MATTITIPARPIDTPDAWRGDDLARSTDWIRPFSPAELDELHGALGAVTRRGLDWRDITRGDFPLARLSRELAAVGREHGRGVVLLRGLPVERYSTCRGSARPRTRHSTSSPSSARSCVTR
jgi:hypothetical protein